MGKGLLSIIKRNGLVSAAILLCIAAGSFSVFADDLEKKEYKADHNEYIQEIPDDFIVPSIKGSKDGSGGKRAGVALPDKYDSRDYGCVSPVEDQQDTELCWAYSAIAASESSIISSGKESPDINLSEYHLGYFFDGASEDKLGLTSGDETVLSEGFLKTGNNNKYTSFALANWTGPAYEDKYPADASFYRSLSRQHAFDDDYHLSNVYWINIDDIQEVKQNIMSHGAVGTSIYYNDRYYNTETNAYFNGVYSTANHAVTIVGWDDTFSADQFNTIPEQGDGAWLVKNSRGTDYFDEGYLWISYYDESLLSATATAFVFEYDELDKYDCNYHYDGSCGTKTINIANGGSIAAVYRAKGNREGQYELLKAVGISVADTNTSYSIQVYHNLLDEEQPLSGKRALSNPQTGQTKYTGCYTIPLDEEIKLQSGELFSIVVTFTGNSAGTPYFIDTSYSGGGWIEFTSNNQRGQTFVREPNKAWEDLCDQDACARIRAFTSILTQEDEDPIDPVDPVDPIDIHACKIDSITDRTYTGSAIKPKIHVRYGAELAEGVDYNVIYTNNKSAGTAKVTINGIGKYAGTIEKTFRINPKKVYPIVTLSQYSYTYDGYDKTPKVYVKYKEGAVYKTLIGGTDYTIRKAVKRRNVGAYAVIVTLKGNYSGTKTAIFRINPKGTTLLTIRPRTKGFTAKWRKQSIQTTGYQIQYATNSAFTSNRKTLTIKSNTVLSKRVYKLRAKRKYYIRIRTYKTRTYNGETMRLYSKWSQPKTVTTKR